MGITLDPVIYNWLVSINVIQQNPRHRVIANGKFELDEISSKPFETGLVFAEIFKNLLFLTLNYS